MTTTTNTHNPHGFEIGCYGDGALGHQHTRDRCADVILYYAQENFTWRGLDIPRAEGQTVGTVKDCLRAAMSDDAWEEDAARDWLNEHAPYSGASWGWTDGDFGLWLDDEDEGSE